jgi:hypothetical protein
MAIETHAMALSHERDRARDLGGWSERVEDLAQIGDAILRARRQTEDGRAAPPSRRAELFLRRSRESGNSGIPGTCRLFRLWVPAFAWPTILDRRHS